MCIIAICEERSLTHAEWKRCWESNGHGMGYAFWDGRKVYAAKGFMKKGEAWEVYKEVPVPHVVHFRIASAGGIIPELTHPFICSKESEPFEEYTGKQSLLFHNGMVGDWKSLLMSAIMQTKTVPVGEMSDSRTMAIAVSVAGNDILDYFDSMKWVVVSKDGYHKVGSWTEGEDGLLFSNGGFKKFEPVAYDSNWPSDGMAGQLPFNRPVWQSSHWNKLCPDCLYYEEPENGESAECGLRGRLANNKACKEFTDKDAEPPKVILRKSCKSCAHYDGELLCTEKGRLKDNVACYEYKRSLTMNNSQLEG